MCNIFLTLSYRSNFLESQQSTFNTKLKIIPAWMVKKNIYQKKLKITVKKISREDRE